MSGPAPRAAFQSLDDSTPEDWRLIVRAARPYNAGLPDRILDHLQALAGDYGGFPVDRLTHSLQTATRAARAGKADDYVVCALVHDIGDQLASFNHADLGAAIVRPFVGDDLHWMVEKHAIFQGYHYFHNVGLDRDMREQFRDHPHFELCEEFCAEFDAAAFDSSYLSMDLADFEPAVREFFSRPANTMYRSAAPNFSETRE